jgi:ribosomal protein L20A (L18A)
MTALKNFLLKGMFRIKGVFRNYSKTISAQSKLAAESKIKSLFGSNYGIKRSLVKIESVQEVK